MPYLIDRRAALLGEDIVAIVKGQHQGIRSRVILRDGSLYQTPTRPRTLRRYGNALREEERSQTIRWPRQP